MATKGSSRHEPIPLPLISPSVSYVSASHESPRIRRVKEGPVEAAARRLRVRRQASLEEHPQSAELILDLWLQGGVDAVREFLFGVDGVTTQTVRRAASSWLPQHPGNVVVTLPPRSFNPRFASPPAMLQLENGLTAAVLERSGAPLATLCLRPVVVPDLDDELAATVLARVARELRELEQRPGWVRVDSRPAQILLAAPTDQFSELVEVLRAALAQAEDDQRPVMAEGGSARRRALRLMAGILGIAEGSSLSPATLLRTGNLSLGVVAEDVEAASEAVRKFWTTDRSSGRAPRSARWLLSRERARLPPATIRCWSSHSSFRSPSDEAQTLVLAEVLASRGAALMGEGSVEILHPFVPGHRVLLVVASASGHDGHDRGERRQGAGLISSGRQPKRNSLRLGDGRLQPKLEHGAAPPAARAAVRRLPLVLSSGGRRRISKWRFCRCRSRL